MDYLRERADAFSRIERALQGAIRLQRDTALVAEGDSLELLRRLPDDSVSLILTDPPYHSTKKSNVYGDTRFDEDKHFLEWMSGYASEWQRVLKMNGTLYAFCSSEMSARLEVTLSSRFRPLNHITWTKPNEPGFDGWKGKMKKESLRQWYPHSERILVFEQGSYGRAAAGRRSPVGQLLYDKRKASGMSMKDLTEAVGAYGRVNHGGAVANWEAGRNTPSRNQYARMCEELEGTGRVGTMPPYEDLIRPMNVNGGVQYTDVWDFPSVRPFKGKHPAEKPLDMLRHVIAVSSYPGDIVLDCFAGSGSTGVAAVALGRRVVCMEIEPQWVGRAAADIDRAQAILES
jgi:adenine-specific DNA-methyltransferase